MVLAAEVHTDSGDMWEATLTSYCLIFIAAGGGGVWMNGQQRLAISAGRWLIADAGTHVVLRPRAQGKWTFIAFAIQGDGVERWRERELLPSAHTIRCITRPDRMLGKMRRVVRMWQEQPVGWADRAAIALRELILELELDRIGEGEKSGTIQLALIDRCVEYCRQHLSEDIDFHALAARHNVSYSLLRKRWNEEAGFPPQKHFTRMRMFEATRLLDGSSASIAEIAEQVGYQDPFSFSRAFKRMFGQSPKSWRVDRKIISVRKGCR